MKNKIIRAIKIILVSVIFLMITMGAMGLPPSCGRDIDRRDWSISITDNDPFSCCMGGRRVSLRSLNNESLLDSGVLRLPTRVAGRNIDIARLPLRVTFKHDDIDKIIVPASIRLWLHGNTTSYSILAAQYLEFECIENISWGGVAYFSTIIIPNGTREHFFGSLSKFTEHHNIIEYYNITIVEKSEFGGIN